jgi:glycosyltransferase involved in cell wall biosynthesis
MSTWHIVTSEYPPDVGGVSDYTRQVAEALARASDEVHVWCPHGVTASAVAGLHVHRELGRVGAADLWRVDRRIGEFTGPRHLLVQWVPHGFGYRSMNVWFCLWLATRAWRGDRIDLMVHEPYLELQAGPLRHIAMALVHRAMTVVLLMTSRRVWMSIPAWEKRLRPYALGRAVPMQWLPVPGCVRPAERATPHTLRQRCAADGHLLVGHFGTYGRAVADLLDERIAGVLNGSEDASVLLIGAGSEEFRCGLISRNIAWTSRVHATGFVPSGEINDVISVCDLFLQPYPDGISSRRTSAMTCLSSGRPVVTTRGHLTESLWSESGAVALIDVNDPAAFVSAALTVLRDADERQRLGRLGLDLYSTHFSVDRIVSTLRAA